ncbi:FHA domain-containing protein, partial [Candidatus Saccharibacteria bacterium]|nr:FHA domain-containing protein [Candidatus Saccharibacteria bacterium]
MSDRIPQGQTTKFIPSPGDTIPFGAFERMLVDDRGFDMVDPSGSVVFSPVPMGDEADIYNIGAPVAEINAGTSRFAVFPDTEGGLLLAVAQKVSTNTDKRDNYHVDISTAWSLGTEPLQIGREDKPGARDGSISARHFQVHTDTQGRVVVADVGSLNGTSARLSPRAGAVQYGHEGMSSDKVALEFHQEMERGASEKTRRLIETFPDALTPTASVQVDGRTFYLTDIIGENGRYPKAVMYTPVTIEGKREIVSRVLYKSNSDGGWRVMYGITGTRYKKEAQDESHYTQETKPVRHILDALALQPGATESSQQIDAYLSSEFDLSRADTAREFTGPEEIRYYHDKTVDTTLSDVRALSAGMFGDRFEATLSGMGHDTVTSYFHSLDDAFRGLPWLVPDFRYPPRATYLSDHTLLGDTTIEEFDTSSPSIAGGRSITWSMAHDDDGRVWV